MNVRVTATQDTRGPRHPVLGRIRSTVGKALRAPERVRTAAQRDYIHFLPEVSSDAELSDLSARVNWYLPENTKPVYVAGGDRFAIDTQAAPHMDPSYVVDPGWAARPPRGRATFVYRKITPGTFARYVRHPLTSEFVDPEFSTLMDSLGWIHLTKQYSPIDATLGTSGMTRLLETIGGTGKTALVLGTGPSAQEVRDEDLTADVRIVCNSIVRNTDFLMRVRPNVIVFYDPVFHYGPNRYAAGFRRDLLRAVELCDAQIVSDAGWGSLLLLHHPELRDRTTILTGSRQSAWRWPTPARPEVRLGTNVLVSLMLPLALGLADDVLIGGCDGREPTENYFWTHNESIQYSDELMRSVAEAHPGFFRWADYEGHYARHCIEMEQIIQAGEAAGKTVRGVTPSWIPALATRGLAKQATA